MDTDHTAENEHDDETPAAPAFETLSRWTATTLATANLRS